MLSLCKEIWCSSLYKYNFDAAYFCKRVAATTENERFSSENEKEFLHNQL